MPSDAEKRRMRARATRKVEGVTAASFPGGRTMSRSGAKPESERERVVASFSPFGKAETNTEGADIVTDHFVIDDKRSEGQRVTFSRTIARKIRTAAAKHNKIPAVQITFTHPIDHPAYLNPRTWDQWMVVPKGVFLEMEKAYFSGIEEEGDDDP
jgi:hypothetical protein